MDHAEARAAYEAQFSAVQRGLKFFGGQVSQYRAEHVEPAWKQLRNASDENCQAQDLGQRVEEGLKPVEIRTKWNGSVCGVWDPMMKQVQWQEEWHGGVAGVWNPCTQQIEWRRSW